MFKLKNSMLPFFRSEENQQLFIKSVVFSFIWGFFAHGYVFINFTPSHDSLFDLYSGSANHAFQITLGRVLLPLYHNITASSFILPWTAGCIALVWLSVACFLTAKLFGLWKTWHILILSGIMVTNRSVYTVFATYFQDAGAYFISLCFAIFSAYNWKKYTECQQHLYLIIGSVSLAIAMGLYQSYISVTLVIIVIVCILDLIALKPVKQVFRNGLWSIAMVLLGCGLYYLLLKFVTALTGISLSEDDYNSLYAAFDQKEPFLNRILYCYKDALMQFTSYAFSIYPRKLIVLSNFSIFSIGFVLLIYIVIKKHFEVLRILFIAVLLMCVPFTAYILRMMSKEVHDIMIYGLWYINLLPLIILVRSEYLFKDTAKSMLCVLSICLLFLIYSDIQTANLAYVHKKMQYEATLSLMTGIMHDVESLDNYVPGETPVVFVGNPADIQKELPGHDRLRCITGLDHISPVTYCMQQFIDYAMQRNANVIPKTAIQIPDAVIHGPCYPTKGYISLNDGIVFVNLTA